jgi:hypothetical protein
MRNIWEAHCNGFSASQIMRNTSVGLSVSYTNTLIRNLRKKMFQWHRTHHEGLMYRSDF